MALRELIDKVKSISIIGILEHYDIPIKQNKISCLWHEEKTPSVNIYEDTNTLFCFGECGKPYDNISITMKKQNLEFEDAINFLYNNFNINNGFIIGKKKDLGQYFNINKEIRILIFAGEDINVIKKASQVMDLFNDKPDILRKLYGGLLTKLNKEVGE